MRELFMFTIVSLQISGIIDPVKLLAPLDFDVREAANGKETIEIWKTWQPHLIWMDMRMPVMDGYEATTRIKATTQGQAMVIIALTASAFKEERAIVVSAGCDDFMRKPFREAGIFAMMAHHLGMRYLDASETPANAYVLPHLSTQEISVALNALPAALRAALRNAVVTVDIESLEAVIEKITTLHPQLAGDLIQFARVFDYGQLEHLLEQADGQA